MIVVRVKRIRHIHRYREIVNALIRYGFDYIVQELGLNELLSSPKRKFTGRAQDSPIKSVGERIRLFLEELGPTFVKLG